MARRTARLHSKLVLTLLGAAVLTALGASPASASLPSGIVNETAPPAESAFGACIAGGGSADLLLLVDESSSLITSDPDLARVTSASYFVTELTSSTVEAALDVSVELRVFGDSTQTIHPWTTLSDQNLPGLLSSIALLADRTSGFDTDYWTALDGARQELAARASARGTTQSCQAIVWFTDGKLDYFPRETAAERDAYGVTKAFAPDIQLTSADAAAQVRSLAASDLCRPGGLADQIRSSNVYVFGVGLNGSTSKPEDFDFVEAVSTGTGPTPETCGSIVDPVPGEFHLATEIDSLLFVFDEITSPGSKPIQQETGICQLVVCSDAAHRFVLDSSTPEVRILAAADLPDLQASVRLPDGEVINLANPGLGVPTSMAAQGATMSYTWRTSRTVSINVGQAEAPDAAWSGLWELAFTDPAGASADSRSHSNIHISGAVKPALLDEAVDLRAGAVVEDVRLGLVDRDGASVDPASLLGSISYSAVLQDQAGKRFTVLDTLVPADIAAPVDIDLSDAQIGPAILTLRATITTAAATTSTGEPVAGTQLEPAVVGIPLTISAPRTFPELGRAIDFGQAVGDVSLTAELTVSGAGCAWVDSDAVPEIVASPQGLGTISISAAANTESTCFAAGAEALPLRLTTEHGGNGSINGTIPVNIASADGSGQPLVVEVAFTASLEKPLNVASFWTTLLAAIVLGVGLPIGLLYLAKRIISKVPPLPLVATLIDVTVEGGRVLRDGRPFEIVATDLTGTVAIPPRGARRLAVPGAELVARIGWSPFGTGFVRVDARGRSSASNDHPSTDASGVRARLPLAVHNHWVLLHTPGAPANSASVLLLIGGTAGAAERTVLQDGVNRRLPDLLARLVQQSEPEAGRTGQDPDGGPRLASPFASAAPGAPASAQAPQPPSPLRDNPFGIS